MRLVSAFLLVALTGSVTLAEEAKPAQPEAAAPAKPDAKPEPRRKVPLRVVKMLPETHQVLLFDKSRGTHVLAETGQDVGGYLVEDIDEDEVTLVTQNGAQVILQAPESAWRKHKKAGAETAMVESDGASASPIAPPSVASAAGGASPAAASPQDPYADAPGGTTAAAPIAAGDGGVPVVSATSPAPAAAAAAAAAPAAATPAPADPFGSPGITAFADAVGASPAPAASAAPAASKPAASKPATPAADAKVDAASSLAAAATGDSTTGSSAAAPTPAVASPAAATPAAAPAFTVSRHEVDAALADFGATAVTFDAAFGADGLRFDHIAKGTILSKLGLQPGDVLTAVDNQPLRSLDDAASLYARAGTAKGAKLHVLRAGAPVTVAVAIR